MKYTSYYGKTTSFVVGFAAKHDDICARHQLLKESGLKCIGEVWVSGYGLSPLWEGQDLSDSDCEVLCIKKYHEQ